MILLDTHAMIWALMAPELLSPKARQTLDDASEWGVSASSLYEVTYKHAIGKWPEVESVVQDGFADRLEELGFSLVPADARIMERAGQMKWAHRDPFDRIIVSTAQSLRAPVVSKDQTLDSAPTGTFTRVW